MSVPAAQMPGADANFGFILSPPQRQRVARILDGMVDGLAQSSGVLTDRAGRIVEIARKPVGVQLPAISALAAGCFATTAELAKELGEEEYALQFQHENDQQVYIWPVADRALLVVMLRGSAAIETLEGRLNGTMGQELAGVIKEAREPMKAVPPPRITPPELPVELRQRTRALTALIMDLQAKRPKEFTTEINAGLLHSRESLVQALSKRDWRRAWEICEGTRQWLLSVMHLSTAQDVGQVLIRLYRDVFNQMNASIATAASPERMKILYASFWRFLARQHPTVFVSERFLTPAGVDVPGLWEAARGKVPDSMALAVQFVPAMDGLVRELLRVIYLSKGKEGRDAAIAGASAILKTYNLELLPYGLESLAGREWLLIPGTAAPGA